MYSPLPQSYFESGGGGRESRLVLRGICLHEIGGANGTFRDDYGRRVVERARETDGGFWCTFHGKSARAVAILQ